MATPKPPGRKKEIEFPDPEKHQQKVELHNEIRQTLLNLRDSVAQPQIKDTILKFTECIVPGSRDVTRLPYVADKPVSKRPNKAKCLYALISWIIQVYWKYCEGDETDSHYTEVMTNLFGLQDITKKGLSAFRINGNLVEGYRLGWVKE